MDTTQLPIYSNLECKCCGYPPLFIYQMNQVFALCDECEAFYFEPQDFDRNRQLFVYRSGGKVTEDFSIELPYTSHLATYEQVQHSQWAGYVHKPS